VRIKKITDWRIKKITVNKIYVIGRPLKAHAMNKPSNRENNIPCPLTLPTIFGSYSIHYRSP